MPPNKLSRMWGPDKGSKARTWVTDQEVSTKLEWNKRSKVMQGLVTHTWAKIQKLNSVHNALLPVAAQGLFLPVRTDHFSSVDFVGRPMSLFSLISNTLQQPKRKPLQRCKVSLTQNSTPSLKCLGSEFNSFTGCWTPQRCSGRSWLSNRCDFEYLAERQHSNDTNTMKNTMKKHKRHWQTQWKKTCQEHVRSWGLPKKKPHLHICRGRPSKWAPMLERLTWKGGSKSVTVHFPFPCERAWQKWKRTSMALKAGGAGPPSCPDHLKSPKPFQTAGQPCFFWAKDWPSQWHWDRYKQTTWMNWSHWQIDWHLKSPDWQNKWQLTWHLQNHTDRHWLMLHEGFFSNPKRLGKFCCCHRANTEASNDTRKKNDLTDSWLHSLNWHFVLRIMSMTATNCLVVSEVAFSVNGVIDWPNAAQSLSPALRWQQCQRTDSWWGIDPAVDLAPCHRDEAKLPAKWQRHQQPLKVGRDSNLAEDLGPEAIQSELESTEIFSVERNLQIKVWQFSQI